MASLEHDGREFAAEERNNHLEACFQNVNLPENLSTFEQIALEGGFQTFAPLYTDPFCFYGAFHAVV